MVPVSPAGESWRRAELRAACLWVVSPSRQAQESDRRIPGSMDLADVMRAFDEMLAFFPVESEVGLGVHRDELPAWRAVVAALEPIWKLYENAASSDPTAMQEAPAWSRLVDAVNDVVDSLGLWREEVRFPVDVGGTGRRGDDWHAVASIVRETSATEARDADGRRIAFSPDGAVASVSLPAGGG